MYQDYLNKLAADIKPYSQIAKRGMRFRGLNRAMIDESIKHNLQIQARNKAFAAAAAKKAARNRSVFGRIARLIRK